MNQPSREYLSFCGTLANVFDREWSRIEDRITAGWKFLEHVQDTAWKPMTPIAIDKWESWPRNWVRGVKEVYGLWKIEAKIARSTTNCEYCNGNGWFSGIKRIEVKPGIVVAYRFTFRCANCRNWFGVLGERVPMAYPLEVKSDGFQLDIYQQPIPAEVRRYSLAEIAAGIGQQVNLPAPRPAIQHYRDPGDE